MPVVHVMTEQFVVHVQAGDDTFELRMKYDSTVCDLGLRIAQQVENPANEQGLEFPNSDPTQKSKFSSSNSTHLLSGYCLHCSTVKCVDMRVGGKQNFFRAQEILRGPVLECLAELFKKRWLVRYPQLNADGSPKYAWSDSMARVCLDGSELERSVRLPGTLRTVARKDGSLSNMLEASEDLSQWLMRGDEIMVAGSICTLRRKVKVKPLQHGCQCEILQDGFVGAEGVYDDVWKMERDIQPMLRLDGKPVDRYILEQIRTNDFGAFDLTAWYFLLVGSSHRLLPHHRQYDYDAAVASGSVTEVMEQSYQLGKVNAIRN